MQAAWRNYPLEKPILIGSDDPCDVGQYTRGASLGARSHWWSATWQFSAAALVNIFKLGKYCPEDLSKEGGSGGLRTWSPWTAATRWAGHLPFTDTYRVLHTLQVTMGIRYSSGLLFIRSVP